MSVNRDAVELMRDRLVRSVQEIERLRTSIHTLEEAATEPIAIVSMACRLPGGVESPEGLWKNLEKGFDAIGEFPNRPGWDAAQLYDPDPASPGKTYSTKGGFLYEADRFDADFFEIHPYWAERIDPQQRILLEMSWEALERAGIVPKSLMKANVGVFVGLMYQDYAESIAGPPHEWDGVILGSTGGEASGRIAYELGLEGPVMTVNTACSSSLVSMHLACQALRRKECNLALAGGATILATPHVFIEFSRTLGLSVDGRCKSFSAKANGVGWAEGGGMLLLERYSDAKKNGHPVLALIRGSAVNSDGKSQGLTAPNGPAQENVIRQALASAGLKFSEVDAVEAHGTGTTLGDPIEAQALLATYGEHHTAKSPLYVGSIKSNIGHPQAASGAVAVIKMVLAMKAGLLPRSLYAEDPTPYVDWSSGSLKLLVEAVDWKRKSHPRRAGVSSFGISGTNAHMILEEAPERELEGNIEKLRPGFVPVLLSGKSREALGAQAKRLLGYLVDYPNFDLLDVGFTLATKRTHFVERECFLLRDSEGREGLLRQLERYCGEPASASGAGRQAGKLCVLFTGQGSQRAGMGKELYGRNETFRKALDAVFVEMDKHLLGRGRLGLKEVMFAEEGSEAGEQLHRTEYAQSALFALEVGLYRVVESLGVKAEVLLGHSIGELVAAHVSGVLGLVEACRLVSERGRLMQALEEGGAMVSVEATEAQVLSALALAGGRASVAGVNGPKSVVVSGEEAAVVRAVAELERRGHRATRLKVSHAFHSELMEPMLEEFGRVAGGLVYGERRVGVVSNLSGRRAEGEEQRSAEYWVRHARGAVRFYEGVKSLHAEGVRTYLELGPGAVLSALGAQSVEGEAGGEGSEFIASMRKGKGEEEGLLEALCRLHTRGLDVDWSEYFKPYGCKAVDLPTYAFQKKKYWMERPRRGAIHAGPVVHPLLGRRLELAGEGVTYVNRLGTEDLVYLEDHRVFGQVVVPGMGLLEMAYAAGQDLFGDAQERLRVSDVAIERPLVLVEGGEVEVQLRARVEGEEEAGFEIYSRLVAGEGSSDWSLHASGTLKVDAAVEREVLDVEEVREQCPEGVDVVGVYEKGMRGGLEYGPSFQGMVELWGGEGQSIGRLKRPEALRDSVESYNFHPALLDAALHVGSVLRPGDGDKGAGVYVPFGLESYSICKAGAGAREELWSYMKVRAPKGGADGQMTVDVTLVGLDGEVLAQLRGLSARRIEAQSVEGKAEGVVEDELLELDWEEQPSLEAEEELVGGRWLVVGEAGGLRGEIAERLRGEGRWVEEHGWGSGMDWDGVLGAGELEQRKLGGAVLLLDAAGSEDAESVGRRAIELTVESLELAKGLIRAKKEAGARVLWVTRGTIGVEGGESEGWMLERAPLWGLGRVLRSEHPELGLKLLDLGVEAEERQADAQRLLAELGSAGEGEAEVALRGKRRLAPRLRRLRVGAEERGVVRLEGLSERGTYLVTGGLGALGLKVAQRLVEGGARRLMLMGRSGMTEEARGKVEEMERKGAQVIVVGVDVSDREGLRGVLEGIPEEAPLKGVVHAAGVMDDGLVMEQTGERFRRVMRPKVEGAWNLHELTKARWEVDFFVLFSSLSVVLGSEGKSSYAAGNAFMDGLAAYRRRQGLSGTSIGWGVWSGGGMAGRLEPWKEQLLDQWAFSVLSPERGIRLLERVLESGVSYAVATPFSEARFKETMVGEVPGLFRGLVKAGVKKKGRKLESGGLVGRLEVLVEEERRVVLGEVLRGEVVQVLGLSGLEEVSLDKPLKMLGLDSLMAIELRNRVSKLLGQGVPATFAFDYPTVEKQVEFLLSKLELGKSKERVEVVKHKRRREGEGIAVVGVGCRFPGNVKDMEGFWRLLREGVDAIEEVPSERWDVSKFYDPDPSAVGKTYSKWGGFLSEVGMFDPLFFGISPREALSMDPQQRLLLETSWEALERANWVPEKLMGSRTGVYLGLSWSDYAALAESQGASDMGSALSVAAGRISYTFGFQGPAVVVDTACSSSLVAVHLAAQALRNGECDVALAGGANLMLAPRMFTFLSRLQALSPTGHCHTFSENADGYVRGEACAMVVLKRLSEAEADGDRILGVIRGSAVNQDGRSQGLTAPNGPAQEEVIEAALRAAGVKASEIDYVECHGTGTKLGDPIEVQALSAVLGKGRGSDKPVRIGSVKSNIGHAEAASGIAGLMKALLALQNGEIPASLHSTPPNPFIAWAGLPVKVVKELEAWPRGERPRRAGVSSFGMSGTNAHMILEEAPERVRSGKSGVLGARFVPILLSGRNRSALKGQIQDLQSYLEGHSGVGLLDVAFTLATRRTHFEERECFVWSVFEGRDGLLKELERCSEKQVEKGVGARKPGKLCVLFTGQGSQRAGMGKELYGRNETFRKALDAVFVEMDKHLLGRGRLGLKEVMFAEEGSEAGEQLNRTEYAQSALFALEVGLYRVVESLGVKAEVLLGHSIGELVAAHVSGVLGLVEACRLVSERGRLMQALEEGGAMVSVEATEAQVLEALAVAGGRASVAGVNGPNSVVVSGEEAAVVRAVAELERRGHRATRLKVSHAFHSELMEPMLEEFGRVAGGLVYGERRVGVVSNLSGRRAEGEEQRSAEYWVRHARGAVRFYEGVKSLHAEGVRTYLELGPGAVLSGLGAQSVEAEAGGEGSEFIASMRKGKSEEEGLLEALCRLHVLGQAVDWSAFFQPYGCKAVDLPTYAFQRQRYWLERRKGSGYELGAALHPLLGRRLELAGEGVTYVNRLGTEDLVYLEDHRVFGQVVVPGMGLLEMAYAAGQDLFGDAQERLRVSDVAIERPLVLAEGGEVEVQLRARVEGEEEAGFEIYSRLVAGEGSSDWSLHASGTLKVDAAVEREVLDVEEVREQCPEGVDVVGVYEKGMRGGLEYGPSFQGMVELWGGEGQSIGRLKRPEALRDSVESYNFHPALLDAALHVVSTLISRVRVPGVYLPFGVESYSICKAGAGTEDELWSYAKVRDSKGGADGQMTVDVTLVGLDGEVLAQLQGLSLRRAEAQSVEGKAEGVVEDELLELDWEEQPSLEAEEELVGGRWLVVGEAGGLRGEIAERLRGEGRWVEEHGWGSGMDWDGVLGAGELEQRKLGGAVLLLDAAGSEDGESVGRRAIELTVESLELAKSLIRAKKEAGARVLWVTRGTIGVEGGESESWMLERAPLWGLGRVLRSEHPELGLKLLDLGVEAGERQADAQRLLAELGSAGEGEAEVALRGKRRLAPRLRRLRVGAEERGVVRLEGLSERGTYLVTGGLGALGLKVAQRLVEGGARRLMLMGRSGMTEEARGKVEEMERKGAQVIVVGVDVSDREGLRGVLEGIPEEAPLKGVVHAAGVMDDGLVMEQTGERFRRVMGPKVEGAWNLHELTKARWEVDFFVLFSSLSVVLGSEGKSSYAAGNAFMDALAAYRRRQGLSGTSIGWGAWSGGGMAGQVKSSNRMLLLDQWAFSLLSPERGIRLLERVLESGVSYAVATPFSEARFKETMVGEVPGLFRGLVKAGVKKKGRKLESGGLVGRLEVLVEEERRVVLGEVLRGEVVQVLGLSGLEEVSLDKPLKMLGLDSLMAIELRNRVSKLLGQGVPATFAFDYPTVEKQVEFLLSKLELGKAKERVEVVKHKRRREGEGIAVVGVGCRFPGNVKDMEGFWRLLREGVDAIEEVPSERWDVSKFYDPDPSAVGKSYSKWGGFLSEVGMFDPLFFGISPREALSMDPQQRLLLETSWEALEQANWVPEKLMGSRTGVYVGLSWSEYGSRVDVQGSVDGYAGTGSALSIAAGRISYTFGFQGPTMVVDTACSSSLVAIHLAAQALRNGECDVALAGGANLMLNPGVFIGLSRLQALSPTGRCHAFSENADGYVRGEACAMLVLKRLSEARADGDRILGVIRGSAVNQDGRSQGLTAPNGPAQEQVITAALRQAGLKGNEIDYVECHGTGTKLGDPIEVQALSAVLGGGRGAEHPVRIGSVKSNIGHAETTSGIAGFIKALLSLQKEQIPASLHSLPPNPFIAWSELPVRVVRKLEAWPRGKKPRRAGISSFGLSGTNAHVILEEAPEQEQIVTIDRVRPEFMPILLSGKSKEALKEQAASLSAHLNEYVAADLLDVAFTLATKRTHFEERAGLVFRVAEGRAGLLAELEQYSEGRGSVEGGAREPGKLCVLFTGQGSQRAGMGQELYGRNETFRKALDAVFGEMDKHLLGRGRLGLKEVMFAEERSEAGEQLNRTEYAQSALFALEVGLYRVVESLGVKVDVLLGHSIGELVAAHVSGVLGLVEACRLVSERGRLMQALEEGGAMVSVEATEAQALSALAVAGGRASVAGVNGPNSVVVSGEEAAVGRVVEELERRGHRATRLKVSHAFHSELMEPMLEEFGRVAGGLVYGERRVGVVSNLSGRRAEGEEQRSAEYWVRHARGAVRFYEGVKSLHAEGVRTYLELGPGAVLSALGAQSVEGEAGGEGSEFIASMRKGKSEEEGLLEALCRLHTRGLDVDWSEYFKPYGCKAVDLPTYAFQRHRYWLEARATAEIEASSVPSGAVSKEDQLLMEWNAPALAQRLEKIAGLDAAIASRVAGALTKSRAETKAEQFLEQNVYELVWRENRNWVNSYSSGVGVWLVLCGKSDAGRRVADLLCLNGFDAKIVVFGEELKLEDGKEWVMNWSEREHWRKLFQGEGIVCSGIVCCAALDVEGDFFYEKSKDLIFEAVRLLQGLESVREHSPTICFLTQGAVSVGEQLMSSVGQSLLWGLGKSMSLEYPRYKIKLIDLDPLGGIVNDGSLVEIIVGGGDEEHFALRSGRQFVERLARKKIVASQKSLEVRGVWMITGGLGALGLHVARWLMEKGASKLILIGRRGMQTPGAEQAVAELGRAGTKIQVIAGDVGESVDFARMMGEALEPGESLDGIVHAAGVGTLMRIKDVTFEKIDSEIRGKVLGAWRLHEWALKHPVGQFILFSSGAAVWGSAGQGIYGAGNSFLDSLARHRRCMGLPGLSFAWGAWAGGGLASDAAVASMQKIGLKPMAPMVCLEVMERLLSREAKETNLVLVEIDWATFRQTYELARPRKLLSELSGLPETQELPKSKQSSELAGQWEGATPSVRKTMVVEIVKDVLARILGFEDSQSIDVRKGFLDFGMDSLMAVEFSRNLAESLSLIRSVATVLPAALVFSYPTVNDLVNYLVKEFGIGEESETFLDVFSGKVGGEKIEQVLSITGDGVTFQDGSFVASDMKEEDLEAVSALLTAEFNKVLPKFGLSPSMFKAAGARVFNRFFRPNTKSIVVKNADGEILFASFLQFFGKKCVSGPVASKLPGLAEFVFKNAGVGFFLNDNTGLSMVGGDDFDGITHECSTFMSSLSHLSIYDRLAYPLCPAASMIKEVNSLEKRLDSDVFGLSLVFYSERSDGDKAILLEKLDEMSKPWDGVSLAPEVRYIYERGIGEVLVVYEGECIRAVACCHYGSESESFNDNELFLKLLYVDPLSIDKIKVFDFLMNSVERFAFEHGLLTVNCTVLLLRRDAYGMLLERGFKAVGLHQFMAATIKKGKGGFYDGISSEQLILLDLR